MLIDNGFSNNFWAKAIKTANYFCNKLLTKSKNLRKVIFIELWIKQQQSFGYVCIFGSLMLANISDQKRTKSDYQKVWQSILIGYSPDSSKYFHVWVLQAKQVIIASKPHINKSKQRAKLFEKWPIEISSKKKP